MGSVRFPRALAPASGVAAGEYHTVVLLADSLPVPELLNPVRKGARLQRADPDVEPPELRAGIQGFTEREQLDRRSHQRRQRRAAGA